MLKIKLDDMNNSEPNNRSEESRIYYEMLNHLRKCHGLSNQLDLTTERLTVIQNEITDLMISVTTLFYMRFRGRRDS